AFTATLAAIHDTPDPDEIPFFKGRNVVSDRGDPTDNFMPGDAWENGSGPFRPDLMEIGMADPAVSNGNLHIMRARRPSGDLQSFQRLVTRQGAVCSDGAHFAVLPVYPRRFMIYPCATRKNSACRRVTCCPQDFIP